MAVALHIDLLEIVCTLCFCYINIQQNKFYINLEDLKVREVYNKRLSFNVNEHIWSACSFIYGYMSISLIEVVQPF